MTGERIEALEAEMRALQERQATQGAIEQAKGMLMGHYGVSADAAFAILVRWSQQSHTKLRDIAAGFVAAAAQPSPRPYGALRSMLDIYTDPAPTRSSSARRTGADSSVDHSGSYLAAG